MKNLCQKARKYKVFSLTNAEKPSITNSASDLGAHPNQIIENPEEEYNMNKTELVAAMAEKAQLSKKDAEAALKAFTDVVAEELKKGEKIQLVGFGTFEVSERAARTGRNPQTGAEMTIAASKAPKFKAGKALKDSVN